MSEINRNDMENTLQEGSNIEEIKLKGNISGRVKPETELEYIALFDNVIEGEHGDKLTYDERINLLVGALRDKITNSHIGADNKNIPSFNVDLSGEMEGIEDSFTHIKNILDTIESKVVNQVSRYKYDFTTATVGASKKIDLKVMEMLENEKENILKVQSEKDALHKIVEENNESINNLKISINDLSEKNKVYKLNESKMLKKEEELEKSVNKKDNEIKELKEKTLKLLNQNNELSQENNSLNKSYRLLESDLKNEVNLLKEEHNSKMNEVIREKEQLNILNAGLTKEVEMQNNTIKSLENKVTELEQLKMDKFKAEQENIMLKAKLEELANK